MNRLRILSFVLLAATAASWAQSEQTSTSSSQPASNSAAQSSTAPSVTPQQSAPGMPPDSTSLEPIKITRADYPQLAAQRGIQGQVMVKLLISETGDVEKVDVLSGDPLLSDAAVRAVKKWKFKPFVKGGKAIKVATQIPMDFAFSNKIMEKGRSADGTAVAGKSTIAIATANAAAGLASVPADGDEAGPVPQRVRVSQGVSQGLLIHQVAPVYPHVARVNHVTGAVVMQAVIGKNGRLSSLRVISGPPELREAAIGAVQQWRYKPYYLKGQPVEVETQITVNFTLH